MGERLRLHVILLWLAYAVGAAAMAIAVIVPVFFIVNVLYNGGAGVTALLIGVVVAWALLARLLVRRSVRL